MMPRKLIALLCLTSISASAETISFEKHIRPIFQTHCFHCHGEDGAKKGDLDVRLKRLVLQGGKSGAAIVVKNAAKSLLFQKVRDGEMPKGKASLSEKEIKLIENWIAQGAQTLRPEPEKPDDVLVTEEDRQHWAYQPIRNPKPPNDAKNPIDAFVLRKLQ